MAEPPQILPKLAEFVYDGLGRLIRTWRSDQATPEPNTESEDYYYDGVRRVLEIVNETELGGDAAREYVWGPGYVDELICQLATDAIGTDLYYYLQDANYNVLAVLYDSGQPALQYLHSPYGRPLVRETFADSRQPEHASPLPVNRIAHQGLFFERLYLAPFDLSQPALTPGGVGLFYNRNRWYVPELGRFTGRDPNATAQPIIIALASNGQTLEGLLNAFDAASHYGDGMNLYLYLGANPVNATDPLGLSVSLWLAETFLAATGGDTSWLDNPELVRNISIGFGLVGAACLGGAIIVAASPAIVMAAQSFQMWVATATSGGGAALLTRWPWQHDGRQIINGITYSVHALMRMAPKVYPGGRGIPPSVVENCIRWGQRMQTDKPGVLKIVYENVTVIFNELQNVVMSVW